MSSTEAGVVVRAERLALHFDGGKTRALDGVDLSVREQEFVAVTGPSGCGKSSLLGLIGALDVPTHGALYFREQAYSALDDLSDFRRSHIGFVFQSFHLIPTLSALDNVLVATIGRRKERSAVRRHAEELLARVGLSHKGHSLPAALSGGERQRVAIARALINAPDVILADEPTGSLDSANAAQVMELFSELRREQRLTMLVATHDREVSAVADRIVAMRDGQIDGRAGAGT